jgi:hypothetical protein
MEVAETIRGLSYLIEDFDEHFRNDIVDGSRKWDVRTDEKSTFYSYYYKIIQIQNFGMQKAKSDYYYFWFRLLSKQY